MPTYNYKSRELIAKIVYYGPGRCGKTTNLQQIHARMRPETRSELLSVATETDRTIYFDLLPLNLGTISGMKFMVRLFTVPGQVYYSETRKLVLKGADGVVFVADSQDHMADENRQSLQDLKVNLRANGLDYDSIPLVMQWNKRDLPHLIPEAELNAMLNERASKTVSAVASQGDGVLETLRHITLGVFNHIKAGGKVTGKPVSSPLAGPTTDAAAAPLSRPAAPAPVAPAPAAPAPARPPAVGNVKPGGWSASIPRTSVSPAEPASRPAPPPPSARPEPRKDGPQPMKISSDMILDEFRNLAVMQSQLAERVSQLEHELSRLGRDNQEIREHLARQSRH
jgi:signal recognition particle receptor subunit beta